MAKKRYNVRVFFLILFFAFLASAMYGGVQTAKGTGKTYAEAQLNAQVSLASQLKSIVSSTTLVQSSTKGKKYQEIYQENSVVDVDIELLGTKYSYSLLPDGNYEVIASIDKESVPQYVGVLNTVKAQIEEIEQQIAKGKEKKTETVLSVLYRNYENFESLTQVVRLLDPDAPLPLLKNTKAGVELDYLKLWEEEKLFLEKELAPSSNQKLSIDAIKLIQDNLHASKIRLKLLEETQREYFASLTDQLSSTLQEEKSRMQSMAQSLLSEIASKKKVGDSPMDIVDEIEKQKLAYMDILDTLSGRIKRQKQTIDDVYSEKRNEILTRPYRSAELTNKGFPTNAAQENRQRIVAQLDEEHSQEVEKATRQLEETASPGMKSLERSIINEFNRLEREKATITSITDGIALRLGTYDGYRNSWPVAIRFALYEYPYSFDVYIPYEKITNKKLPALSPKNTSEWKAYEEYLDAVDLFEAYFASFPNALYCTIEYSIQPGEGTSEYVILLHSVNFFRSDTGKVIYTKSYDNPYEHINIFKSSILEMPDIYESSYEKYLKDQHKKIALAFEKESKKREKETTIKKPSTFEIKFDWKQSLPITNIVFGKYIYGLNISVETPLQISKNTQFKVGAVIGLFSYDSEGFISASDPNSYAKSADNQDGSTSPPTSFSGFELLGSLSYAIPHNILDNNDLIIKIDGGVSIASAADAMFSFPTLITLMLRSREIRSSGMQVGLQYHITGIDKGLVTLIVGLKTGKITSSIINSILY